MSGRGPRNPSTRPLAPVRARPVSSAAEHEPLLSISSPLNYIPTVDSSPPRRRTRTSTGRTWAEWAAGLLVSSHASTTSSYPSSSTLSTSASSIHASSSLSSFPSSRHRPSSHFPRTVAIPRSAQQRTLRQRCLRPLLIAALVIGVIIIAASNRLVIPGDGTTGPPFGPGRLHNVWVPSSYQLDLAIDPEVEEFSGRVVLNIKAIAPTTNITLHAVRLNFTVEDVSLEIRREEPPKKDKKHMWLGDGKDGEEEPVLVMPTSLVVSEKMHTVTLMLPSRLLPADQVTLAINYTGTMGYRTTRGFYRSPYSTDGKAGESPKTLSRHKTMNLHHNATLFKKPSKPSPPSIRHLAATHFEPFGARLAFPCLDEPHLKAEFIVTVDAPQHLEAVSNGPVESVEAIRKGWKRWRFAKTRKMSTYLVAWGVGDVRVGARGTTATSNTPVRVFTLPGKERQAVFALDVALASIDVYEKQFGSAFPMPKLDLFPMPDFSGEGMENWGFAIFEEAGLMVTPDASSDHRVYVSNLVAHEIAHQWLGDLVTMEWWNDLWLNEAFAEWAQHPGTDAAHPSWKAPRMFFEYEHMLGLRADASFWSRPVWLKSVEPWKVGSMFDDIVYNKGASLIRMMQSWLDKPDVVVSSNGTSDDPCGRFCRSLKRYLQKYSESVATTEEFLDHLDDEEPSKIISTTFRGWLENPGFPVVFVGDNGQVMQERFTLWKSLPAPPSAPTMPGGNQSIWIIPFAYRYISKDPTRRDKNVTRTILIQPDTLSAIPMPPSDIKDPLLLANPDRVGFFRFMYSDDQYTSLSSLLTASHTAIPAQDRAGLISDTTALLLSGRLAPEPAFSVLKFLSKETDHVVWRVAAASLTDMQTVLLPHKSYPAFRRFALSIVDACVDHVGFPLPNATGDFALGMLRPAALSLGVRFGRPTTLATSFELFTAIVKQKVVPPFLESVMEEVLVGAVKFDAFRTLDLLGGVDAESMFGRNAVVKAYAASPYRSHHEMLLDGDGEGSPDPDVLIALAEGSETGHLTAWRVGILRVWRRIKTKYPNARYLAEAIGKVVERLDDEGPDFRDALAVVGVDGRNKGDMGEWRREVVEPGVVNAVRMGIERAWVAGEFRRVHGDGVEGILEGFRYVEG
ncbi:peptidase family M1-domain-containing protein [Chytridium lagenaria]|nr:peptidase family M1-domain-containing protein [Chytridium lagenaria]